MNRFEQLIEYVINDEEQKARELFHEIVVAKSREIYENLMQEEEELDEAKHEEEELDEAEEMDEAKHEEEELDEAEEMDEAAMGGDASDDLIDEVETDEQQDMSMEAEEDDVGGDMDMGGEEGSSEPATKDDIMNLEDKLDELMAEFEAAMGGDDMGNGDDMGPEEGGDAIEVDDTEEMMPMAEAINLKQVHPKTTTHEEGDGKAGPVAFNSGAAGMASKPVKTGADGGGHHDSAAYKNTTKDLIGKVGNSPAQGTQQPKPATKPHLGQATGVNTKSPLPSGRKG